MANQTEFENSFKSELINLIPSMRAYARSLCRNVAQSDDLAQDALARAWAARDRYTIGTNLRAWIFTIIRNQYISDRRRSWRSLPLTPGFAEENLIAVTDPTANLDLDELRRALAMLPEDQREALILIGAGGLSYDEAGEICGVPIGTIKSRVSRARDRLASIMSKGFIANDDVSPQAAMATILQQLDGYRQRKRA